MSRRQEYCILIGDFNEAHVVPKGPAMKNHATNPSCWCDPDYHHDDKSVTTVYLHYPAVKIDIDIDKEDR